MKAALYFVTTEQHATEAHTKIPAGKGFAFVRAVVVEATDLVDAMDKAEPRDGESFMNSHDAP